VGSYFGIEDEDKSMFPVKLGSSSTIEVNGYLIKGNDGAITDSSLVTFVSGDIRFIYDESGIQEGYFENTSDSSVLTDLIEVLESAPGNSGKRPEIPAYYQEYIDQLGGPYIVPTDADYDLIVSGWANGRSASLEGVVDRNGTDIYDVFPYDYIYIEYEDKWGNVTSEYTRLNLVDFAVIEDGQALIMLLPGTFGLDNEHSPYTLTVYIYNEMSGHVKHDSTTYFTIEVSLANYEAVGTGGVEELTMNLDDWVYKISRTPDASRLPSDVDFMDIVWGTDEFRYVAVGDDGSIWYNQDANFQAPGADTGWLEANNSNTNKLLFVEYINGLFIAGGENGTLIRSGDGINWESAITYDASVDRTKFDVTGIAFDDESLTYMASITYHHDYGAEAEHDIAGIMKTSTLIDKTSWSLPSEITGLYKANDITFAGSVFMIAGADGEVAYSDTGATWTILQLKDDSNIDEINDLNSIAIHDGAGVIVGQKGTLYSFTYTSGLLFDKITSGALTELLVDETDINDVEFTRGTFIAVGDSETIIYYDSVAGWVTKSDISITSGSDTDLPVNLYGVIGRE
ncbi:MAG: hypothetical protein JXQ23_02950, partial [Clostridia bacterium]|nr:hypothetical protein [Clostridia bacterium]